MLERVWRKGNPPTLLVGIYTVTINMENGVDVPQKNKHGTTILSSNHTPGPISGQNFH